MPEPPSAPPDQPPCEPPARPPLGLTMMWSLAGYALYMACQWGMLVVVARLGSPEKVGELAYGIALSAPVILFASLGLRKVQVTDVRGEFEVADYLGLRVVLTVAALVVLAAIALGSSASPEARRAVLAVGIAKAVEAASDIVYGVLQRGERMGRIAFSLFLRGVLGVGALALGMALTGRVAVGMLGVAAAWTAVLVGHDVPRAREVLRAEGTGPLRPRWSPRRLGRLALVALPLGIVTPLVALLSSIPAVLIEHWRGAAELGLYTALAYAYAAANRIASAMGEAASARLAASYAAGERRPFARTLGGLLVLAGMVGGLGLGLALLAGRPLLGLFYGQAYADRSDILVGFMAVAIAGNLTCVLDYSMTAMRRLRIQPILGGLSVLVLGALARELIPTHGLRGAVAALGGVALFQGALTLAVVVRGWIRFPKLARALAAGEA